MTDVPAAGVRRRRRSPVTAVMVVIACPFGLWHLLPDILFALEGAPQDLGGDNRPLEVASLRGGLYARVRGVVEGIAGKAELAGDTREIVLLQGQPIGVLRARAPKHRPDGLLLQATGRIYRGDQAGGWQPAADLVALRRNVSSRTVFLLVEGAAPKFPWGTAALSLLLLAVLALNLYRLAAAIGGSRHGGSTD